MTRPGSPHDRLQHSLNRTGCSARIVKNIGSLSLLKSMADRMNIRGVVDTLLPMERERGLTHGQVVEALVLNRCHAPVPLYEMENWAQNTGLSDLYNCKSTLFNDDRVRSTLDVSHQYDEDILSRLALGASSEFGVPLDGLLYDLTSLYFEGDYDESDIVKYGYSRDQKPDKKQVNLGLTVSKDGGVPLYSKTLEGNESDPTTVHENVRALKRTLKQKSFVMITDGGMLTPATVHALEKEGISFVAPWQATTEFFKTLHGVDIHWEDLAYKGPKGQDTYRVAEWGLLVTYEEELKDQPPPERKPGQRGALRKHPVIEHRYWERALLVYASGKASRDEKTRTKRLAEIEEALAKIESGLNKRRLKTNLQVATRIEKLFSKQHAHYRPCFTTEVAGEDGHMTFTWSRNQEKLDEVISTEGMYVLLTNQRDSEAYSSEQLFDDYKGRNPVESRIRDLKDTIKIRPLYVHTDERIKSLVMITVIALQLYSLIEWEAKKAQQSWTTRYLKRLFSQICILQTVGSDGSIEVEWCNVQPHHQRILQSVGLTLPRLPEKLAPFD